MVHCYKLGGLNIVLDVYSGSVHVVDEVAYDMIEAYERADRETIVSDILKKYEGREDVTREEVEECFDQIEELRDAGKLFVPDTFEPMAGKLKEKTSGVIKALCMHIAHTCNLIAHHSSVAVIFALTCKAV